MRTDTPRREDEARPEPEPAAVPRAGTEGFAAGTRRRVAWNRRADGFDPGWSDHLWRRVAGSFGNNVGVVAVAGLAITLLAGLGVTKLTFATGQDSYLNADDRVAIDTVAYQGEFGGQAMLVLLRAEDGTNVVDLLSPQNQAAFDRLATTLQARPDLVESVVTPSSVLVWSDALSHSPDGNPANTVFGKMVVNGIADDPSDTGKAARVADSTRTLERFAAIPLGQRRIDNRAWVDLLLRGNDGQIRKALRGVILDERHVQVVVRLKGNAALETESAGAQLVRDAVAAAGIEGATITVTGAPVLIDQINSYLRGGMLNLGGVALAAMALIIIVFFRVRWRLLPLAVIVVGVVWAFGLAGFVGVPISLVTIAGLPVMLGVGIDYAIQLHARVEEEIADGDARPIETTARHLGPALVVVTFDAVFAFVALRFAKVPMIREFGLLLAIGVGAVCLATIVVTLTTLGLRERTSPSPRRAFEPGPLGRLVVRLGSTPAWAAPVILLASVAVFVGGARVEDQLSLQTDPLQWVDQHSAAVEDFRVVERATGSRSELGIYITSADVFDQGTVDYVATFARRQLAAHPSDLLGATSLVTTVDYLVEVPGATSVLPRAADVRAAYDVAPAALRSVLVDPASGSTNLIFRYGQGSLEEASGVVHDVRTSADPPPGITATPAGLAVVGVGLFENLTANRVMLTYVAIAFVGLFLAVRLRSVVRALLSLVPVLIAVGAASLIAFGLSMKLSPMTAVGGPLVIAACTEFTSLILLRFIEERRRGCDPKAAADMAAARTGRAFIVSGLTAVAGVVVLATSALPLLRDFGIIVAVNVAVALVSALVVLPPLLVWADERGWVSKGMLAENAPT